MIIPPDAPYGVQKALQELDARLIGIERSQAPASQSDLQNLKNDLLKAIADATIQKPYQDTNKIFRGGLAHALGYVPDPGLTGLFPELVLREDAKWTFPASGNLVRADADADFLPINLYNFLSALVILGSLTANHLNIEGNFDVSLPKCRAVRSTTQSTSNQTWTAASLDTSVYDSNGFYASGTPKRLTIPVGFGGFYLVHGACEYAANATGGRACAIALNDDTDTSNGLVEFALVGTEGATTVTGVDVSAEVHLKDGDYLTLKAWQDSTGSLNLSPSTFGRLLGVSLDLVRLGR